MFPLQTLFPLTDQRNFVIAYSGGLDSHVLLHTMFKLKKSHPEINVQAVHVNHQLNPLSNNWEKHCAEICDALNIPIKIEKINIDLKPGDSLEEQARNARYAILQQHIDKNSVLLTAHNANDQAETFLLQALRGAGPKGLSAMPIKKKLGEGFLIRPLLHFTRDDLESYAKENNLKWIEDDSNVDIKFNRNYLRHEIFPVLKKRFPAVMENFSRSSRLMAEQEAIIADIAKDDLKTVQKRGREPSRDFCDALDLKQLLLLSESRQRLVLREWFRQNNLRMPNEKHLKQIQKDVLNAAPDAHPVFQLGDLVLLRERGVLCLKYT
ncbi:MAG: tRNA lysidine(34) synthetase TilS [Gammaproteobacteria bacterium]|nr:tRNA lysidine(34) synthetase TilS [Gammaproteobacteria bacterium]